MHRRLTLAVGGWALYAERLAAEIGLYEDDPYGDLGRLRLELGQAFDIKEFHRAVLGNGSVPLEILENLVEQYIYTASG